MGGNVTAERAHGLSPIDELIGLEQRLAKTLDLAARATPPATNSAAAALLDSLRQTCQRHRAALEAQRQRVWADAVSAPALSIARSLGQLYAALNQTALAYAVLHTRAHRAFDSQAEGNTASLAESHLRAYTAAIQLLDLVISDVVVGEPGSAAEDCRCQCPACSLGLCLCSPHGTNTIREAWEQTLPARPSGGLRVRRPRPGSAAELAGLLEGDHVVAIDGDDIETDLDAAAVQAALLASASASIRLRVLRAGEPIELSLGRT